MRKIDKIDKKIIYELDRNARRSVNKIAKKLKLKRETVSYRIKQLEKNKIIKGYYTLIDYSKLGYILIRLYFKFQDTTLEIEKEIIDYLVSLKSTLTVYKIEGDWDLAMGFLVKSLDEFDKIYREFQSKYRKFIHSHNITVFLEYKHFFRNYLVDEKLRDYSSYSTGNAEKINFDKKDIEIIKILAENAKIPLLDIANKLNLTSMAVRYRIRQLADKKVILAYRTLIDYSKLGYGYYKIDLDIEDISKLKQLQNFIKQHPDIIYQDRTIGGSDIEFDAELQDHEEFHKLIEEIKKKFPGIIRTYKYYKAREILKYIYFPE